MKTTNLRWLSTNLDFVRVPLNATERAERKGDYPYWGANGIVDYVDDYLINEPVVLIGEDGAPFFDPAKSVAFLVTGPIWPNNHIHVLKPNPKLIHDGFLCYALNTVNYAEYINGSTRDKLTQSQLGSIKIMYPDLPTQKRIADFLDRETARIDQLIEKRKVFLDLVGEKKRALAVLAVNGTILYPNPQGAEGWFGRLPVDWQTRRGKFLFRERQDRSVAGEEELLTVSHITGVSPRSEKDVNMFLAESMEGYKLVTRNDVVVNTMWAWMGAMGVSPVEGIVSPSYGVYAPIGDSFRSEYLDLLLRSQSFVAEVNRRSKGIWSSRLRLYPDAFLDIVFPVPPTHVQQRIMQSLQRATEKEIRLAELSQRSLDRLQEFRSSLITTAVTGQIDVDTWCKHGDTDRRLDALEQEASI